MAPDHGSAVVSPLAANGAHGVTRRWSVHPELAAPDEIPTLSRHGAAALHHGDAPLGNRRAQRLKPRAWEARALQGHYRLGTGFARYGRDAVRDPAGTALQSPK